MTDQAGNLMDGDANGVPGGQFVKRFSGKILAGPAGAAAAFRSGQSRRLLKVPHAVRR